jgi:hypothetical protein
MNARKEADLIVKQVQLRTNARCHCDTFSTNGYEARGFYNGQEYVAILQQGSNPVAFWATFNIWLVSTPATRTLFDATRDQIHDLTHGDGTRTPFKMQALDHLAAINVITHAINHPVRSN